MSTKNDAHAEEPSDLAVIPPEPHDVEAQPEPSPFPDRPTPVSRRRLYLMVLADFGLSFTWLCKFAVATPYFQHTLKAGPFLSHLVWIMGPLSGLIVAPVVGVLSDRCTNSFGRRRPFILGGMIACVIGMNVFANAKALSFGFIPAARWLAVFAFGVLDFSTNAIMFPSRALLGDLLPSDEQHSVQGAAAVVASLAEICAGAYLGTWTDPVTHVSRVFVTASILLVVTCSVSLYVCHEEPLKLEDLNDTMEHDDVGDARLTGQMDQPQDNQTARTPTDDESTNGLIDRKDDEKDTQTSHEDTSGDGEEEEDDEAVENRLSAATAEHSSEDIRDVSGDTRTNAQRGESSGLPVWRELAVTLRSAIINFPRPLIRVGIVYGLAWFVWFASLPFYSQWLGVDVLKGDPHAEAGSQEALSYQKGVTVFAVANVAKAGLAMAFSAFYPSIIKFVGAVGERVVFGASFFGFSVVLFKYAYTKSVVVAAMVIALGSVPFIVTQTIPIAIVVQRYPENLASNLGVLNLFCVIPQLIDTLYTGKVAELAGESAVLRVASIWGFAAGIAAVLFL